MNELTRHLNDRDSVLGRTVAVSVDDPHAAFDALAEALGSRYAARQYAADLELVARLEGTGR